VQKSVTILYIPVFVESFVIGFAIVEIHQLLSQKKGKQNAANNHSLNNKYTYPYHVFVNKAFPSIELDEPLNLSA
jgi:hypothetical protein